MGDIRSALADELNEFGPERIRDLLEAHGYRLSRRIRPAYFVGLPSLEGEHEYRGIILDVETTGKVVGQSQTIQLAMLEVFFTARGISRLGELLCELNDPVAKIPDEAVAVHGLTNEKLKGHAFSNERIREFLDGTEVVIAHNANFDRKFVERDLPNAGFDTLPWACSLHDINWAARGVGSSKLEYIALSQGAYYGAHDAGEDVLATAFCLNGAPMDHEHTPFAEMLRNARRDTVRITVRGSRLIGGTSSKIKDRGYVWSGDDGLELGGRPKRWWREISGDDASTREEAKWLRQNVTADTEFDAYRLNARNRFSGRVGDEVVIKFDRMGVANFS
ncbi:exonuclease domain-containing protein [Roseovarius sp. D22-M7]|uniref:exonuclease domain-containing protein n=1 Tax=Roseovarius sp. D22-M7 TaxID=3127116 RepID=UPI00300FDF90